MTDLVKLENEQLKQVYSNTLDSINRVYKEGFYAWVQRHRPDIAKRLFVLDEEINKVWEKCINGEATLLKFTAGVKLYEETVKKTLKLFNPELKLCE